MVSSLGGFFFYIIYIFPLIIIIFSKQLQTGYIGPNVDRNRNEDGVVLRMLSNIRLVKAYLMRWCAQKFAILENAEVSIVC
jgi:hypothetical protein